MQDSEGAKRHSRVKGIHTTQKSQWAKAASVLLFCVANKLKLEVLAFSRMAMGRRSFTLIHPPYHVYWRPF